MPGSPLDLGALPSLDDVEFVEKLGHGLGAGRFRARLGTGEAVALLLEDTALIDHDRFAAWGRALAALDHQGVPQVVRVEDALQPAFVAFSYIDGQNLEARLAIRGEGLPELDALSVVLQAAAGIRAAHRVGVAHGELDARSIVLVDRPGGLDGAVVVGWTPSPVAHAFAERARADLKALGSLLYVALTGIAPPSSHRLEVDGLEGGGGAFDDILMDWVDVERNLGGLGRPALDALADSGRYADVPAFIDALLPHFRDKVEAHLAEAAGNLEDDRTFMDEVERQRARLRELEARQRAVRDWLHSHTRRIERCDADLAALRERVAALQSIETEMGLLAGQAARPAARLPDRLGDFDPRRGWSAPPAGLDDHPPTRSTFDAGPDHRVRERVSRTSRGPGLGLRGSDGHRTDDGPRTHTGGFALPGAGLERTPPASDAPEVASDETTHADEQAEREANEANHAHEAEPAEGADDALSAAIEPPVVEPLPERRLDRALHDETERPTGGVLIGALGVAVVLGVLGAAWLLAGTDRKPSPAPEAPTVQTGTMAPIPTGGQPQADTPPGDAPAGARPLPPVQEWGGQPIEPRPVAAEADASPAADPESDAGLAPSPADPQAGLPDAGAGWNPTETFDPVDVRDGAELGPAPEGMVPVSAGLVQPGLAEPQRAAALAQCRVDLEGYPESWCAERLAPTIEPVAAERPVGPLFADVLEVSQAQYRRCATAGVCESLRLHWDLADQPATGLTRDMAAAYCAWREARLPTADEWLYLARGGDGRLYPWGDEGPGKGADARANYGRFTHKGGLPDRADRYKYAARVDELDGRGESPFGIRNLAGNVREWTTNEVEGQGVTMGGGWREAPFELRVTRREATPLDTARNDLGFRCVADPSEGPGAGADERK